MPRSRNGAVGAASAPAERPRPGSAIRLVLSSILSSIVALAAPSSGLGGQAEPAQARSSTKPSDTSANSGPPKAEEVDTIALRAQTQEQLKSLETASSPGPTTTAGVGPRPGSSPTGLSASPTDSAMDKQLGELLRGRLGWLEAYDRATIDLKKATAPERSPEQQLADAKEQLGRAQAILAQAASRPESLLPAAYRGATAGASAHLSAEMKDAMEAATNDVKDWRSRLETLRTEVVNRESQQNVHRTERDKLFQRVASLKARAAEHDAVASATTARERRLAQERLINAKWESRVEGLRFQVVEAQIALETKLAAVRDLNLQACQAQIQVAEKTLDLMMNRYRAIADRQERTLKEKAAQEDNTARRSEDPLERFIAHRTADLLELEAQVVKNEQAEVTSPPPSLNEQRNQADHAEADFARIKALLDDGRVSRLDAIRLNNDFRRIGPERDRLLRNEMTIVETRLQYYEDVLTSVEIELLRDSLHDRGELDRLRERLPASRWPEAERILAELERKHRALLLRRRAALERLTDCTTQTLEQISRRLSILDEEYGFIRTHIFWVRDQEPIGLPTINLGAGELKILAKALATLTQDAIWPRHLGRTSPEFLAAALAVLVLPIGLFRLRRFLRARLECDLPANTGRVAGGG